MIHAQKVRIREDPVRFYAWLRPRVEQLVGVLEGGAWEEGPEGRVCGKKALAAPAHDRRSDRDYVEDPFLSGGTLASSPCSGGGGDGGSSIVTTAGRGAAVGECNTTRGDRAGAPSSGAAARATAAAAAATAAATEAAASAATAAVAAATTASVKPPRLDWSIVFWFACTAFAGAACLFHAATAVLLPAAASAVHMPLPAITGSPYELRGSHSIVHHGLGSALRKVHAIGDLHGDAVCAQRWIEHTGLVTLGGWKLGDPWRNNSAAVAAMRWLEPHSVLLFLGDYLDRGPGGVAIVDLVRALTERFPDNVIALLGNHELYSLQDVDPATAPSARYSQMLQSFVHPAELAAAGEVAAAADAAAKQEAIAAGKAEGTSGIAEELYTAQLEMAVKEEAERRQRDAESLSLVFEGLQRARATGQLQRSKYARSRAAARCRSQCRHC